MQLQVFSFAFVQIWVTCISLLKCLFQKDQCEWARDSGGIPMANFHKILQSSKKRYRQKHKICDMLGQMSHISNIAEIIENLETFGLCNTTYEGREHWKFISHIILNRCFMFLFNILF